MSYTRERQIHALRTMFFVWRNRIHVKQGSDMNHWEWIYGEFRIPKEEYENLIIGEYNIDFTRGNSINLACYKGDDKRPIEGLNLYYINQVGVYAAKHLRKNNVWVYNGIPDNSGCKAVNLLKVRLN